MTTLFCNRYDYPHLTDEEIGNSSRVMQPLSGAGRTHAALPAACGEAGEQVALSCSSGCLSPLDAPM